MNVDLWTAIREYIAAEIKLNAARETLFNYEHREYMDHRRELIASLKILIKELEEQSTRMDTYIRWKIRIWSWQWEENMSDITGLPDYLCHNCGAIDPVVGEAECEFCEKYVIEIYGKKPIFARQLERKLAAAKKRIKELEETMSETPKCELCGEPMPTGEEMFKFYGYSGDCPKPSLKRDDTPITDAAAINAEYGGHCRPVVPVKDARLLEEQLAAAQKRIAELEASLSAMIEDDGKMEIKYEGMCKQATALSFELDEAQQLHLSSVSECQRALAREAEAIAELKRRDERNEPHGYSRRPSAQVSWDELRGRLACAQQTIKELEQTTGRLCDACGWRCMFDVCVNCEYIKAQQTIEALEDKLNCNRCNKGHETLPLKLWNCPACCEEREKELKDRIEARDREISDE